MSTLTACATAGADAQNDEADFDAPSRVIGGVVSFFAAST